jgi:hypothetical protein
VLAVPPAAQYEAMTELPDPVDQDREEVLTIGGWTWRAGSRQGVITIIAAIAIAAGVLTGLLVTHQHTAASHPAPPGGVGVQPPTPLSTSPSRQRTTLQGGPVTGTTGVQLLISPHLGWPLGWFSLDTGKLIPLPRRCAAPSRHHPAVQGLPQPTGPDLLRGHGVSNGDPGGLCQLGCRGHRGSRRHLVEQLPARQRSVLGPLADLYRAQG